MVVFIFVEMLHLQPVLLLDAEAPVLAVADLDLVRPGPALGLRHQEALTITHSLVLYSQVSVLKCFLECFVNDGANVARLADQPVLLHSYKTLARLSRGKFMSSPNIQSTRMLRRQNY